MFEPKNPDDHGAEDEGQSSIDTQDRDALADVLADLHETGSLYRLHVRAVGNLERALKSLARKVASARYEREGLKPPKGKMPTPIEEDFAVAAQVAPEFVEVIAILSVPRKRYAKRLKVLGGQLPVADLARETRGLGTTTLLSLGELIGVTGDLDRFANPAKLWKYMGLGRVNNADGSSENQRKRRDKDKAAAHAYAPWKRALMYVLAENLMKLNKGEYRELYDAQKATKLEAGWTKGHAHNHALRLVAKRLLRNLWRAWRWGREPVVNQGSDAPPPTGYAEAAE